MKLTPIEEKEIRNYSVADFEEKYSGMSALAHEWADFLIGWKKKGFSFLNMNFIEKENRFKPGPFCCRFLDDGLVFVEERFAYTIYHEWLLSGEEFKAFCAKTNSLKYETPMLRLTEPDFYTVEQKMEAREVLENGWYKRKGAKIG